MNIYIYTHTYVLSTPMGELYTFLASLFGPYEKGSFLWCLENRETVGVAREVSAPRFNTVFGLGSEVCGLGEFLRVCSLEICLSVFRGCGVSGLLYAAYYVLIGDWKQAGGP